MRRRILLTALTASALLYGAYLYTHGGIPAAAWRHMFPQGDFVVRRELAVVMLVGSEARDTRPPVRLLLDADVLQITNLDFPVRSAGDKVLFVAAGDAARESWAGVELIEKETRSNGSLNGWLHAEALLDDDGCKVFYDEGRRQYYVFYEDGSDYEKALRYLNFLTFRETLPELEFTQEARAASGMFGEGGGRSLLDWARGREVAVYGQDGGFEGGFYVREDGKAVLMRSGGRDAEGGVLDGGEDILLGAVRYSFNCGGAIILDGGDNLAGGYLAVKYCPERAEHDDAFSGALAWVEAEENASNSTRSREMAYGGRVRHVDEMEEGPFEYEFALDEPVDDAVVMVRYAAEHPGATMEISIDGGEAARIECESGGDWESWGLGVMNGGRIETGAHRLTVTPGRAEMEIDCFVISRRKASGQ